MFKERKISNLRKLELFKFWLNFDDFMLTHFCRLGTQNGIEIEQVGRLKDDNKTLVVKGSYSYTGADGRRYRVRYTADELGFQ